MRRKGWCKCHLSKQQARRRKRDTRSERTQPEDEAGSGGRGGMYCCWFKGVGCSENGGDVVAEVVFTKQCSGQAVISCADTIQRLREFGGQK